MNRINSLPEESSSPSLAPEDVRSLVRLAPMLMLVIALGGCKPDPKLAACQIETARIEGILKGVGIEHEPVETGNLQECLVANERVKGVMRGAAMKSDTIKVQLEALGVDLSFSIPAGKSHPELSEEGDRSGRGAIRDLGENPGDPLDLAEYSDIPRLFDQPAKTGDRDIDSALIAHVKFAFLSYKEVELENFLQPAADALDRARMVKSRIDSVRKDSGQRTRTLRDLIRNREATVNSGNLLKGSPRRQQMQMEAMEYRRQLSELESASSLFVEWSLPQYESISFPALPPGGSNNRSEDRAVFDDTQKVKINIDALIKWLEDYLARYRRLAEPYPKEREKLAYYRDMLLNTTDGSTLLADVQSRMIDEKADLWKKTILWIGYVGNPPRPVPELADAIQLSLPKAPQGPPPRPTPTISAEDFFRSLP